MSPPPRGGGVEASAPCRVDLGGSGGAAVSVAIDRRVSCRVQTGVPDLVLESKDTLRRVSAASLGALRETGALALAAEVLRGLGVEGGVHVTTHSRLPEGTGLGSAGALAVALTAAGATALGRNLAPPEILRRAEEAVARAGCGGEGGGAAAAALLGGAVATGLSGDTAPEPLAVDPARLEESLLLVDTGTTGAAPASGGPPADAFPPEDAGRVRTALLEDRLPDLIELWAEEWEAGRRRAAAPAEDPADRVAALVRQAGGAVRRCGAGHGRVLAVWAPPGERGPGRREAVRAALEEAGVRLFAARVDLRGLEVE